MFCHFGQMMAEWVIIRGLYKKKKSKKIQERQILADPTNIISDSDIVFTTRHVLR